MFESNLCWVQSIKDNKIFLLQIGVDRLQLKFHDLNKKNIEYFPTLENDNLL